MLHRRDAMLRLGQFGLGALSVPGLLAAERARAALIACERLLLPRNTRSKSSFISARSAVLNPWRRSPMTFSPVIRFVRCAARHRPFGRTACGRNEQSQENYQTKGTKARRESRHAYLLERFDGRVYLIWPAKARSPLKTRMSTARAA